MPCSRQTVFGFRGLTTAPSQNAPRRLDVGFGAARGEELGGLHGGDLLRNRRRAELLILVPSSLLISATAAFRDAGSRNG